MPHDHRLTIAPQAVVLDGRYPRGRRGRLPH